MDKKISNTEFDKNNSVSIFRPDNFLLAQLHTNLSEILPKKEQEKEYVVTLTQDRLEIQTDFIYKKKTKKSLHLYSISQLHNFFRITIRKVKFDEDGVETIEDTPISIKKDNIIDSIYIYVNELLGASENFEDKN